MNLARRQQLRSPSLAITFYGSDLTHADSEIIAPFLPSPRRTERPAALANARQRDLLWLGLPLAHAAGKLRPVSTA